VPSAPRTRPKEVGRGERVVPGVWRLRLPLPWPGVPHGNAWALACGDGIVLVDTGLHDAGSMGNLERALDQVGLHLELVRLIVCTHAHADHFGQAASIKERAGCEVWMHPNHEHATLSANDPEAAFARRIEIARQSGVPEEPLRRYAEERKGQAETPLIEPVEFDRDLVPGVQVESDLGSWDVIYTPGHAPSHVTLHQPEKRMLISGDHLLGRVSLYYDYGYSPDPAGEFLDSLEKVDALDARLCLAGHGRPFTDVAAHVRANQKLVHERLDAVAAALSSEPRAAFDIIPEVYGEPATAVTGHWWLSETLVYLNHLQLTDRAAREPGEPERWRAT
jgi:glyoxylase-like metal-dependent hydrolase (beta-lactamase superfamily II)